MTAPIQLAVSRALAHLNVLASLRNPVAIRGCVIVHTPVATELYFKDARAVEHAGTRDLLNAMGREAFFSYLEAYPRIQEDLRDGVTDRPVLVTVDRRTDRVSEWWVGRRNDWSGRHGLRARLLAQPEEQPAPDEPGRRAHGTANGGLRRACLERSALRHGVGAPGRGSRTRKAGRDGERGAT